MNNGSSDTGPGMGPVRRFEGIVVVPATQQVRKTLDGGPIWPDFERDRYLGTIRQGQPVDPVATLSGTPQPFHGAAIWGGQAVPHFGHFVSEQASRLPAALAAQPDATVLLTAFHRVDRAKILRNVAPVLEWFGVKPERFLFVDTPLTVETLYAAPLAETLCSTRVDPAYLDLLDGIEARNGRAPIPSEVLFVSRAGMARAGSAAFAGETYLEEWIRGAGFSVIRPETLSLPEQLAHYAGARHIVFSEGSAIHGRQLIARKDQEVTILCRRANKTVGKVALAARVNRVSYAPTAAATASPVTHQGAEILAEAMTFLDLDALMASVDGFAPALRARFDPVLFRRAALDDFDHWLRTVTRPAHRIDAARTREQAILIARAQGLAV